MKESITSRAGTVLNNPVAARLAMAATVTLVAAFVTLAGSLNWVDRGFSSAWTYFADHKASGQTVIVGFDERSIAELGTWPLSRQIYVRLLKRLDEAGVERIYFDALNGHPGNAQDDKALRKALSEIGPSRIALPVVVVKEYTADHEAKMVTARPLDLFASEATLVSADISADSDYRTRTIGRTPDGNVAALPAAAAWLANGGKARPGAVSVNFGIALDTLPRYNFLDILSGNYNPADLRGRKIIVGESMQNVGYTLNVPRYDRISRADFLALATETVLQKRQIVVHSTGTVVIFCFLLALSLALWMFRLNLVATIGLAVAAGLAILSLSLRLQIDYLAGLPVAGPLLTIVLTAAGCQIAVNQRFGRVRSAITGLIGRVDFGLASYFHNKMDAIITFSPSGEIITVNAAAEHLFSIKAADCIGKPLADVVPGRAEELIRAASEHKPGRLELVSKTSTEDARYLDLAVDAMPTNDGWIGFASIRDVSESRQREERLRYAAEHDPLTGLPNRAAFQHALLQAVRLEDEAETGFSILLLDLDGFKAVNDTLGHQIGDDLLCVVADRLKAAVRADDLVARLGGDEFIVLTRGAPGTARAERLAKRIVAAIRKPAELHGEVVNIGTSIGIASYGVHGTEPDQLVKKADEAMYKAKRGRQGFTVAAELPATA